RAFLNPVRNRTNLVVITHALADRVVFDGLRARAVDYIDSRSKARRQVSARREIILAGGAMASPGILQRSGIGDAGLLRRLGIALVHDNPRVGEHLIEHRGIMAQWKLRIPISDNLVLAGLRLLGNVARYFLNQSGAMASAAYEIGAWFKSSPQ